MPIETGNVTTIRPAGPSSRTEGPGSANAASGASEVSGFSPRTDVSIRGAVSDMAGVLSKIAQNQTEAVEQMPQELQKVVDNVLQQAFSVDETLAQGLGSTLESQRFTIDQLSTLSRMLGQMAALSDAGGEASADETMQALLTGLKSLLSDSGAGAEPVLLTKAAFELLDNQEVSNLPKGIQDLLAALSSQGGETGAGTSAGEPMQLLVKLVRSFMPPSYQEAQGQAGASNAAENVDLAAQNRAADGSVPQGAQKSAPAQNGTAARAENAASLVQNGTATRAENAASPVQNRTAARAENAASPVQNGTAARAENASSPVQNGTAASSEDAAAPVQVGQKSAIAGTAEKGQMQQGNQPAGVDSKGNSDQNPHIVGKEASADMQKGVVKPDTSVAAESDAAMKNGSTAETMGKESAAQKWNTGENAGAQVLTRQGSAAETAGEQILTRQGSVAETAGEQILTRQDSAPEVAVRDPAAQKAVASQSLGKEAAVQGEQTANLSGKEAAQNVRNGETAGAGKGTPLQAERAAVLPQENGAQTKAAGNVLSMSRLAGTGQVRTNGMVSQQETNPSRFAGTDTEAAPETGKTQTMLAGSADRGTAERPSGPASYAASVRNHAYQAYERAGNPVFQQPLQPDDPDSMQFAMAHAKNAMLASKIQNTPETMQTLRNLAALLLQNAVLSDSDTALLQNFLQGNTQAMPQKNLDNLQNLLRLVQQNIPTSVQQAAIQQNIPDLPKVWSFMQLADMTNTRKMNAAQLKRAGKDIASFATSLKHAMTGDSVQLQDQRALDFMQPVYLNNGKVQYPAYIHVYDENKKDARTGEQKKETWFRVCMLTQHIGAIELTCRVYDEGQLDMRMFFSNSDTAEEFIPFIPEIKDNLKDSSLHIHDFHVDTEGAVHF